MINGYLSTVLPGQSNVLTIAACNEKPYLQNKRQKPYNGGWFQESCFAIFRCSLFAGGPHVMQGAVNTAPMVQLPAQGRRSHNRQHDSPRPVRHRLHPPAKRNTPAPVWIRGWAGMLQTMTASAFRRRTPPTMYSIPSTRPPMPSEPLASRMMKVS